MAIILEPRLTQLLIDYLETHLFGAPWDHKKIVDTLKDDLEQKETQANCEHTISEFTGKKTCCTKCGGFPVGEGFSWQLLEVADTATPTSN